ncbi:hypothetical protein DMB42_11570 [Nonomuraea sp. WAC 01424]|uniref:HK97 gp10 family phage protein n=1 Tax=Nonomuraea sp. WAC 01424 TaxID=2203200 RepID=UPI000F7A7BE7|nr:HK97 gp10 family phage protein [Nonomuraea sp. WAC 01424]RSN12810.1 hypothetical protein DMB42_11570 [Nonomuraea sp. WAC 01424]
MGWDVSDLDRHIGHLGDARPKVEALAKVVVKKIGFDTVAGAQSLAPVDTGNLVGTIGVDPVDEWMGFEAGPTASYGADVEFGTQPHEIRAKGVDAGGAKALIWEGAAHPVRSVQHPGTAPQPYMRPAFEKATAPIDDVMSQVGKKALE